MWAVLPATAASLEVVQPAPGTTVFSNPGNVAVHVRSGAPLTGGQRFELWVDGAPLPPASPSGRFEVTGLPRGEHSVRAFVLDGRGRAVEVSPPVTFYVWKASRLFPNRRG